MKSFLKYTLLFVAFAALAAAPAMKSYKVWNSGFEAGLVTPTLDANKATLFPTYTYSQTNNDDTIAITPNYSDNHYVVDSLSQTTLIEVTPGSNLIGGEDLYLQCSKRDSTVRTVYVKTGATIIDTIVANSVNTAHYKYNGTRFYPVKH